MKTLSTRAILSTAVLSATMTAGSLPVAANGDGTSDSYFAYARAGTLGFGFGGGYRFNEHFAIRGGVITGDSHDGSRRIDEIRYDMDRKIRNSAEALIDWYPFQDSGFRVSAGLMTTDTRTELTARADQAGNYVINGNVYTAEEVGTLTARVSSQTVSPYIGVGWESPELGISGLRIVMDAGVLHLNSRRASISTSGHMDDTTFLNDLTAEERRIKDVNDVAFDVSLGIRYTF